MSNGHRGTSDFWRNLRAARRPPPGPDCPDEERLRLLAVGLTNSSEADELLEHAATCGCCGALLRDAVQDLATPPTGEEINLAGADRIANHRVRRDLARRLAEERRRRWFEWIPTPRLVWTAPAAALAALAVIISPVLIQHYSSLARAQRSTNRAYAAAHLLPMRFAGVAYASVSTTRGGEASPLSQPVELFEAEANVKRGVDAHPDDSPWLQLQGRIDLLVGKEDAAIAELERAQSLRPQDPYILSDLGAAHYRKAEKAGDDPQEYSDAFENFSKGLELAHNDPVLLFNTALAAERLYAYHEAQDDWTAYLKLDFRGGWASEARTHLEALKKKLERQAAYAAATTPDALMAELRSSKPWNQLFAPDEEYLKVAVTRLLPAWYGTPPDETAGRILHRMADAFMAKHQDTWLRDVLRTARSPGAAEAFAALSQAVQAESSADFTRSSAQSDVALRLFRSAGSRAGALRADFERLQALRALIRYRECAQVGQTLLANLRVHHYPWLGTQTLLESAVCEAPEVDFERAWTKHRAAILLSKESGYSVLLLRAMGLSAYWQRYIGNFKAARQGYKDGLALYWSNKYPLQRAQFFYGALSLTPAVNAPYSAKAWARETVEATASLGLPDYHAGALHQLALAEMSVGMRASAQAHFTQYSRVLDELPTNEQRQVQILQMEIERAEAEASLGEVDRPLARLVSLQEPAERSETLLRLRFNTDLARLRLRHGDYDQSRTLLQRALAIGNGSRANLSPDSQLPWAHAMGDIYRALVECEIRRRVDPSESWALWSRYRAALFDEDPTTSVDRGALAPGEALLSFAELPSGVAAWLATPAGFRFRWLDPQTKGGGDAAGRLVRGCATDRSPISVLRADARQVSQWLVGPWDQQLDQVRTLVIETDGPVASLPWPALVRSNGHYWSQDFATRIRVWAGPHSAAGSPLASAKSVLVVGEPALAGDTDLPPLPEARDEAEQVSARFLHSVKLVGRQATLTEIRSRLETVELFHFAGHGYGGEGGGLILRGAGDGPALLGASQIQGLDLSRCRLAVLSACATGSGERNGAGDPQSLVRAFLRAGVGEVVASFWNLSSAGTHVLMREFYAGVPSGASVAECLRIAAATVRAHPEYRHPYYWAGFQVFSVE